MAAAETIDMHSCFKNVIEAISEATQAVQTSAVRPKLTPIYDAWHSMVEWMNQNPSQTHHQTIYQTVLDCLSNFVENVTDIVNIKDKVILYNNMLSLVHSMDLTVSDKKYWMAVQTFAQSLVNASWKNMSSSEVSTLIDNLLAFVVTKQDFGSLDNHGFECYKMMAKYIQRFAHKDIQSTHFDGCLSMPKSDWMMIIIQFLVDTQQRANARYLLKHFRLYSGNLTNRSNKFKFNYMCSLITLDLYAARNVVNDTMFGCPKIGRHYNNAYKSEFADMLAAEHALAWVTVNILNKKCTKEDIAFGTQWNIDKATAFGMSKDTIRDNMDCHLDNSLFENIMLMLIKYCGCINCLNDLTSEKQQNNGIVSAEMRRRIVKRAFKSVKWWECKGCHAIYCSKKCQKAHWRKGGHVNCARRKKN